MCLRSKLKVLPRRIPNKPQVGSRCRLKVRLFDAIAHSYLHSHFYEPDLGADPDSLFARSAENKLVRRS